MKKAYAILLSALILGGSHLFGQIVGTNAFMKGVYVEVGENHCGAYGSSALPPAGYHPTLPMTGLGFVADSDEDGWGVGTPHYCGDYFVPGSPVEGWALQVGGTTYRNTDQYCSPDNVPGSITSYDYTAGVYTTVWEGNVAALNLSVTQTTTLPDSSRYFVTRILLCNDGATDLSNVYYMRNVDPDNDQPWSGDFTTSNQIVFNPPADPDALVTSEGLTYGCFLGMGARDTNARASFGCFSTLDGTPQQAWSGTSVCPWSGGYSLSGSNVNDCANQITFYIPVIPAGECECIAFAYILDADELDDALAATSSIGVAADGVDISATGVTLICPTDSVEIEIIDGEDYDWTWDPPTGLTSPVGDTVVAHPDATTTYTATGVGICGTITRTVTVEVPLPPLADAGPDQFLCPGDSVILVGSGGVTYEWSPPVYLSATDTNIVQVTNPLTDMFYQLIVFDSNGCPDTDNVSVTLYTPPEIQACDDQYMVIGGLANLSATGGVNYSWSPPDWLSNPDIQDPVSYAEDTIMYYVTGTDEHGCQGMDSVTVFVLNQTVIVSPTAFTPNGDGMNDTYKPVVIGAGSITDFSIYNRWGSLLYKTEDPQAGWDGKFQNTDQEVGSYVVVIHGIDAFDKPITKTSTVVLMR